MTERTRRLLASPLLHFALLGGVLFLAVPDSRPVLFLDGTPSEREIEDAILFQEARAAGLLEGPVVENRLARVGAFVSQHPEEAPAEAAHRARALGLDESDVVVRRYVSELMRLDIAREADHPPPSEQELEAHLRENAARFERAASVRVRHVFVSSRNGEATQALARALRERLAGRGPDAGSGLGDPFPLGQWIEGSSLELDRRFGPGFGDAIDGLPTGAWQGPFTSTYGLHWVFVEGRTPARVPSVSEIRGQLVHHLIRERRAAHLRRRISELRERYDVRVERPTAAEPPLGDSRGA
ncbi:MAG: peptidylprolyl isomerase [Myxococcota bacterium]|nr:peptidylprolyl isomerase [Myxococcota bacterium]